MGEIGHDTSAFSNREPPTL